MSVLLILGNRFDMQADLQTNYALGIDPKTITTQMGQSNLTITLDTYVNLFDDKVND